MGRIGETLRQAREDKNLTLRDAETATKIRLKYLEALENDNYAEIPGRVYVIGFLKSYAKFLELEDHALVEEYKAANKNEEIVQSQTTKPALPKNDEPGSSSKLLKFAGVALVIALLFTINYIYQYNRKDLAGQKDLQVPPGITGQKDSEKESDANQSIPAQSPSAPTPVGTTDGTAGELEQIQGIKVQVKVLPEEGLQCWLRVIVDGKQVFSGTLQAGESMEFNGNDSITIKYGNAGAVQVSVNGQDQGIVGPINKVLEKEYKNSDFN